MAFRALGESKLCELKHGTYLNAYVAGNNVLVDAPIFTE